MTFVAGSSAADAAIRFTLAGLGLKSEMSERSDSFVYYVGKDFLSSQFCEQDFKVCSLSAALSPLFLVTLKVVVAAAWVLFATVVVALAIRTVVFRIRRRLEATAQKTVNHSHPEDYR